MLAVVGVVGSMAVHSGDPCHWLCCCSHRRRGQWSWWLMLSLVTLMSVVDSLPSLRVHLVVIAGGADHQHSSIVKTKLEFKKIAWWLEKMAQMNAMKAVIATSPELCLRWNLGNSFPLTMFAGPLSQTLKQWPLIWMIAEAEPAFPHPANQQIDPVNARLERRQQIHRRAHHLSISSVVIVVHGNGIALNSVAYQWRLWQCWLPKSISQSCIVFDIKNVNFISKCCVVWIAKVN